MNISEEERIRFNKVPNGLQHSLLLHVMGTGNLTVSMDRMEEIAAETLEEFALEEAAEKAAQPKLPQDRLIPDY